MIASRVVLYALSIALLSFAFTPLAFAVDENPQYFNYQGRFMNSAGTYPLTDTINLQFQVYDPSGTCLLYAELDNSINLSLSNGNVAVKVGSLPGNPKRGGTSDPGFDLATIFKNTGTIAISPTCPSGYTPVAGDARLLRVIMTDVTTSQTTTLTPDQTIGSVPYATIAETLQGIGPSGLIQVQGSTVTQANVAALFSSATDASSNGWHNHDSRYAQINGSTAQNFGSSNLYTTGRIGVGTLTPQADIDIERNGVAGFRIGSGTSVGNTTSIDFYGGGVSRASIQSKDNANVLNFYTGGSQALQLDANQNAIFSKSVGITGTLGLGQYTSTGGSPTEPALIAYLTGLGVTAKGTMWENISTNTVRYWDGSAAQDVANVATTLSTSLASGKIYVGNGSNLAAAVSVSGDATLNNTGVLSLSNSAVMGQGLGGYTVGSNTAIGSTDTIVQAFGKTQGQINALNGSVSSFTGNAILKDGSVTYINNQSFGGHDITNVGTGNFVNLNGSFLTLTSTAPTSIPFLIKGAASQSADLLEVKNNAGTILYSLNASGAPVNNADLVNMGWAGYVTSAQSANFIHKDGSVVFTNNQSFGGFDITNAGNINGTNVNATSTVTAASVNATNMTSTGTFTGNTANVTSLTATGLVKGGSLAIKDSGSTNTITMLASSLTGNLTWNLPTGNGGSGNLLQTDGAGHLTWVNSSAVGFSDPTTTRGDIIYHAAGGTTRMGLGSTGQIAMSNGTDLVYNSVTGDASLSGAGVLTLGNTAVTGQPLTGLPAFTNNAVVATDSILQAFSKVQGEINATNGAVSAVGNAILKDGSVVYTGNQSMGGFSLLNAGAITIKDSGSANTVGFKATGVGSNISFTVPSALPSATGQVMIGSSAGVLSFVDADSSIAKNYVLGSNVAVSNTDTFAQAFGKVQAEINATNGAVSAVGNAILKDGSVVYTGNQSHGGFNITNVGNFSGNNVTATGTVTAATVSATNITATGLVQGGSVAIKDSGSTNTITMLASSLTGNLTWNLPTGNGGSGNLLQTDGAGHLTWVNSSAVGFSDPTTTRGDIIYHAAGGTTRMGLGSTGQIAISNGTDLVYTSLNGDVSSVSGTGNVTLSSTVVKNNQVNVFTKGAQEIDTDAAGTVPLILKGFAGQSVDLLDVKNSAGSILYSLNSSGTPGTSTDLATYGWVNSQVATSGANYLRKDGTVALTGDWNAGGSNNIMGVKSLMVGSTVVAGAMIEADTINANTVGLIIKGSASQSADYLDVKSSTGSTLIWVDKNGVLNGNGSGLTGITASSMNASNLVGQVPLNEGGTNANLTALAGGIVYGTSTGMGIASSGTSGQLLTSGGTGAPTWTSTASTNTASTVVLRDSNSNFSANQITANAFLGNLTGNVTGNVTGSSSLNVLKAGDTMTGTLNIYTASDSVIARLKEFAGQTSDVLQVQNNAGTTLTRIDAAGKLGLVTLSADPGGLTAADTGKVWYNSSSNQIKFYNGTAIQALGVSGSGIQSINGDTTNAQVMVGGTNVSVTTAGGTTTVALTGTVGVGNGGTGVNTTPGNGQLLIGNSTGYTLANLLGTANRVSVSNTAGGITLSGPQDIATTSTVQFGKETLNTSSASLGTNTLFGINAPTTQDNGTTALLANSAATNKILVLQGSASQSVDYFEVQSSTGSNLIWVDKNGILNGNGSGLTGVSAVPSGAAGEVQISGGATTTNDGANFFYSTATHSLGIGTSAPGAQLQVSTTGVNSVGEIIKGIASQSADLLQVKNSAGAMLLNVAANGNVGVGTTAVRALDVVGSRNIDPIMTLRNTSNGGMDAVAFVDDAGTWQGFIGHNNASAAYAGNLSIVSNVANIAFVTGDSGVSPGLTRMTILNSNGSVGIGTTAPGAQLQVSTGSSTTIGEIIQASAGQSADLFEVQNAAGTNKVWIDSNYVIHGNGSGLTGVISSGTTASGITGVVAMANGGTSANLTALAGGIVYGTSTGMGIASSGTSGQLLTSGGTGAPTWTSTASTNTASTIVLRDSNSNFSANQITANAFLGNLTGNVTGSSSLNVLKAGDTMSGTLNIYTASDSVIARLKEFAGQTSDVLQVQNNAGTTLTRIDAAGKLGLVTLSADPGGLTAADTGKVWYNSASNQIKFYNGTAIQALGVQGSGIQSINGDTSNAQVMVGGTNVGVTTSGGTTTVALTGTVGVGNGGTGVNTTPGNGQLLIGNSTGYTLANLLGTANRVSVSNTAGGITLSGPQDIATTSTVQFAKETLNTSSASLGTNTLFGINAPTTTDNLATAMFATSAATNKGLVVQGSASQSVDYFEVQSSTGSNLIWVDKNGVLNGNGSGLTGVISSGTTASGITGVVAMANGGSGANLTGTAGGLVYTSSANQMGIVGAGTSGQVLTSGGTATPVWTTSTSSNVVSTIVQRDVSGNFAGNQITANTFLGNLTGNVTGNVTGSSSLNVLKAGDTMTGTLNIFGSADAVQARVRGFSGQTSDLQQWQNGAGTTLAKIDFAGKLGLVNLSADPGAFTAGDVGKVWYNSTTNTIKFYDGTSAKALGVSGSGIQSINGDTTNAQVMVGGTNVGVTTSGGTTTVALTGTVGVGNGGTGVNTTPGNGQLLIGNSTGYTLANLLGTANRVSVSNTAGGITLSGPQDIATTSTVQFGKETLNTSSASLGTNTLFGINAPTTTDNLATAMFATSAATNKGLVVQGSASQSVDYFEVQSSTGSNLIWVDKNGVLNGNGSGLTGVISSGTTASGITGVVAMSNGGSGANLTGTAGGIVYTQSGTQMGVVGAGTSGQVLTSGGTATPTWTSTASTNTASTIVLRDSNSNFSANQITANAFLGNLTGNVTGSSSLNVLKAGDTMTGTLNIFGSADAVQARVRGFSGQTSDLQQWQNGAGTTLAKIDFAGKLGLVNLSADPGAFTVGDVGKVWYNSTTNTIKFYDGTSAKALGVSGSGIQSINGDTTNAQVMVGGTNVGVTTSGGTTTVALTGTVGVGNGGTGVNTTPGNGQLLIGNSTGYTLANLLGTANRVSVSNTAGGITLSGPQDIATTSTVQFAKETLNTSSASLGTNTLFGINAPTTQDNATTALLANSAATNKILVLQGVASQSVDYFEVQSSTGSNLIWVDKNGVLNGNGSGLTGVISSGTTASGITGVVAMANGGTSANLTALAGGIVYGTSTGMGIASSGTSGQLLTSGGTGAPTWTSTASTNTASTVVLRDSNSNFSANQITANAFLGNVTGNVTGSSSLNVLKAGDTMTGTLNIYTASDSVIARLKEFAGQTSDVLQVQNNAGTTLTRIDAAGKLGLVTLSADPSGLTAVDTGKVWYNSASNQIKFYNGTAIQALGVQGSGIQSINGDTTNAQVMVGGTNVGVTTSGGTTTVALTGTVGVGNGGTGVNTTPGNGQLLIGNSTGYTLANLLGTANRVSVSNTAGGITLSGPQDIATTSTVQFGKETLNTSSASLGTNTLFGINAPTTQDNATTALLANSAATNKILVLQGVASQSVDYFEVQSSTGSNLIWVDKNGVLNGNGSGLTGVISSGTTASGITGVVAMANGGSGANLTGTAGGIVYTQSGTQMGVVGAGTSGQVLTSGGTATPTWTSTSSTNTASTVVLRDSNSNFSANQITANAFLGNLTGNVTGSSSLNVLKAGDTMSGTLNIYTASDSVIARLKEFAGQTSDVLQVQNNAGTTLTRIDAAGKLGLVTLSADPGGLTAADTGKVWYNSASNQIKFYNGTAIQALGVQGSGIQSINGDTSNAQVMVGGTNVGVTTSGGTTTVALTGTVGVPNGGTGLSTTPGNGQLLIGNSTGYTLANLLGTANRVSVSNTAGGITLSGPQDIATTSTVQFGKETLNTSSASLGTNTLFGINAPTTQDNATTALLANSAATNKILVLQGVASQSVDYFEVQSSTGSNLIWVDKNGVLNGNGSGLTGVISSGTTASGITGVVAMSNGGSGANLTGTAGGIVYTQSGTQMGVVGAGTSGQVLTSGGTATPVWTTATSSNVVSTIVQRDVSGNFAGNQITANAFLGNLTGNVTGSSSLNVLKAGDTMTGTLNIYTASDSVIARLKEFAGQTSDVLQVQNNAGTTLTRIDAAGKLGLVTLSADPSGLTAVDTGKVWYNSSSNQIKFYNGTAIQALGVSGSGIQSINGDTSNAQVMVGGTNVSVTTAGGTTTVALTGTVGVPNGGTGVNTTPGNGQLLIGNSTGYTLANLLGTANRVSVSNTAGGITLSGPQDIAQSSTVQHGKLSLNTASLGTNTLFGINAPTTTDNLATAMVATSAATNKGLVVQGSASQSVDYFEVQSSTGSNLIWVDKNGVLNGNGSGLTGVTATPNFSGFTPGGAMIATSSTTIGQDAANFFWDSTNHRLGIGTTSPLEMLQVVNNQNAPTRIRISNGNTGSSPIYPSLQLDSDGGASGQIFYGNSQYQAYDGVGHGLTLYQGTASPIDFITNNTLRMIVTGTGKVGIGRPSPNAQLEMQAVNSNTIGQIIAGSGTQSVDYFEVQTSGGTVLFSVDKNGVLNGNGSGLTGVSASAPGSSGAIPYNNGSGVFTADSANFFWDGTNHRLGIGTTTPTSLLHVYQSSGAVKGKIETGGAGNATLALIGGGSEWDVAATNVGNNLTFSQAGTEFMRIYGSGSQMGNVGIGTTAPGAQLHVNLGTTATTIGQIIQANSAQTADLFEVQNAAGTKQFWIDSSYALHGNGSGITGVTAVPSGAAGEVQISGGGVTTNDGANFFYSTATHSLGIGTSAPGAQLQVSTTGVNNVGEIIKGIASQSADLLQVKNSAGAMLLNVAANGNVGVGTNAVRALDVVGSRNIDPIMTLRNTSNGGMDAVAFVDDAGTWQGFIGHNNASASYAGNLSIVSNVANIAFVTGDSGVSPGLTRMTILNSNGSVGIGTTAPGAQVHNAIGSSLTIGEIIQASGTQSADFFEVQNAAGTKQFWIDSSYILHGNGSSLTGVNAAASGNAGAVQIAGAGNVTTNDQANFFWDATNHRLGLGTTSPPDTLSFGIAPATTATRALINLTGTALNGTYASSNGTFIGANPSSAGADFINYQVAGGAKFRVDVWGTATAGAFTASAGQIYAGGDNNVANRATWSSTTHTYITSGNGTTTPYNIILKPSGTGLVGIGTTAPGAQLEIDTSSVNTVGEIIKGKASQSADLLQLLNSSGTALAVIDSNGIIVSGGEPFPTTGSTAAFEAYGQGVFAAHNAAFGGFYVDLDSNGTHFTSSGGGAGSSQQDISFHTNNNANFDYGSGNGITMIIKNSGNIGIGTTTPSNRLSVSGVGDFSSGLVAGATTPNDGVKVHKFAVVDDVNVLGFHDDVGQIQIRGATSSAKQLTLGINTSAATTYGWLETTVQGGPPAALALNPDGGGYVGIGTTAPGALLDVKGHVANSGTAATVGTCGTTPAITGNDTRGVVTLGTGSPVACTITFASAYTTAPICVITPVGGLPGAIQWYVTTNTTTLVMNFSASPTASQQFSYNCMQ